MISQKPLRWPIRRGPELVSCRLDSARSKEPTPIDQRSLNILIQISQVKRVTKQLTIGQIGTVAFHRYPLRHAWMAGHVRQLLEHNV